MNGFRKLQKRLTEEGWYVGWGHLCCQSCAWMDIPDEHDIGPFKGEDVDLSKVLFNHEQDCENEEMWEEIINEEEDDEDYEYEGEGTVPTYSPEEQDNSTFCFNGDKTGVKNLKAIIPIIEECGCSIHWNGKGDQRPTISWEL